MAPTSKDGSRRGNCPLPHGEAVTRRMLGAHRKRVRGGDRRASTVPAAAVIPAPGVSVVDAAVKTSAVGPRRKHAAQGRVRRDGSRSGPGARYGQARDEMAKTLPGPTAAQAAPRDASEDQGRRPEDRR